MARPARFHLDESADGRIAIGLRLRARDCTTSKDAGLVSATDDEQLAFAIQEGRVLITRDSDFTLLTAQVRPHAGVIYWCSKKHFGRVVKEIDLIASETSAEQFHDRLLFL